MKDLGMYNGFPIKEIPESVSMVPTLKQTKFPKRKNKRISARWRNNKKNWATILVRNSFVMNGWFLMDAKTIEKVKEFISP